MNGRIRPVLPTLTLVAAATLAPLPFASIANAQTAAASKCAPDNAGIKLQPGFCATLFADSMNGARRVAVASNGDVFVAVSGRGATSGIVALRELNGSGRADTRHQFATGFRSSEVALFDGHLYAEASPPAPPRGRGSATDGPPRTIAIVRYALKAGELTPSGVPDTIVQGLPMVPGHSTRNFAIGRDGAMYVNIGSATNACQEKDRIPRSPGVNPCTELETRAGIWKFNARKTHQTPSAANHFARGIRNGVGIAINPADGKLWVTQHGRDDLASWFARLNMDSTAAIKYNAENPAEELLQVNQGDDFGWPYCHYSVVEKHLVQSPEYGGDGKKVGDCASKKEPVAIFPGHWAPNGLFFYTGAALPAKYKNGAFIAFHGSWNRAPEAQKGYNVVFQPLSNGASAGKYEVFAEGFSTNVEAMEAGRAQGNHRPTAVAQASDGSLYIVEDTGGRIFKVIYRGK